MLKNLSKTLVLVLLLALILVVTGCSSLPGSVRQALATAIAAPTEIPSPSPTTSATPAPAAKATTQPRATAPAAVNNPLAQLRRLGLEGGVVAANDGNSLSVKLGKTTDRLQIAPTTLLVVPGIKNAQTSDIQVGDRVIAKVPTSDTNSVPSLVLDLPKGYTTDNVVTGLVQINAKGTVTLRTRNGQQDTTPTASTAIVNMLGDQPALGAVQDIARGDAAVVIGQKNGDQFNPQVIVLLDRAVLQSRQNRPTPTPTP